jgi:hypothetical protein
MLGDARSLWQSATSIVAQALENLDAENRNGLLDSENADGNGAANNLQNIQKELDEYKRLLDEAQMQHFELSKQSRLLIAEKDAEITFLKSKQAPSDGSKPAEHTPESSLLMQKLLSEKKVLEASLKETEDKLRDILHEKNEFDVLRKNYKELQDRFDLMKADLISLKTDLETKEKQKTETIDNLVSEYSRLAADSELQQQKSSERILSIMRENEVLVTKISALEHSIEELANRSVAQQSTNSSTSSVQVSKSPPSSPFKKSEGHQQDQTVTDLLQVQKELKAKIVNLEFDLNEKQLQIRQLEENSKENALKNKEALVANASGSEENLQKEKKKFEELLSTKEIQFNETKKSLEEQIQQLKLTAQQKDQERLMSGESEEKKVELLLNQSKEAIHRENEEKWSKEREVLAVSLREEKEKQLKEQRESLEKERESERERVTKESEFRLEEEKSQLRRLLLEEKEKELNEQKQNDEKEKEKSLVELKTKLDSEKEKEINEVTARKTEEKEKQLKQLETELQSKLCAAQTELLHVKSSLGDKANEFEEIKKEQQKETEHQLKKQAEQITREMEEKWSKEKEVLAVSFREEKEKELKEQRELLEKERESERERVTKESEFRLEEEKSQLRRLLLEEKEKELNEQKQNDEKEKEKSLVELKTKLDSEKEKEINDLTIRKDQERERLLQEQHLQHVLETDKIKESHAAKINSLDKEIQNLLKSLAEIEGRHEEKLKVILEDKEKEKKFEIENALKVLKEEMQVFVDKANAEREEHLANYTKERKLRKKIHNKLLEVQGNIRVICRVRPVLEVERKSGEDVDVTEVPNDEELLVQRDTQTKTKYEFDRVFGQTSAQEEVFEAVQPLCVSVLDGYNVCIFAYGQTGSGYVK